MMVLFLIVVDTLHPTLRTTQYNAFFFLVIHAEHEGGDIAGKILLII